MTVEIYDIVLVIEKYDWKSFICHEAGNINDIYACISSLSQADALGTYIIKRWEV